MKPFTESERQEFLAGVHVGVLSVAATDGRPPASVPIWYGYAPGGDILINTGASSRKTRLIEQAGAMTLAAQREEPPYQYVVVEGTVVETTKPTPLDVREEIAIRYLGEEARPRVRTEPCGSGERVVHRPSRPVDHRRFLRRHLSAMCTGWSRPTR